MATFRLKIGTRLNDDEVVRQIAKTSSDLDMAMYEGTENAAIRLQGAIKSGVPFGKVGDARRSSAEHARETWDRQVNRIPNGGRAIISSDDPVAGMYYYGTSEHKIPKVPKGPNSVPRTLRFFWKGQMRHFKQVTHPGTKPHPYIEQGGQTAEPMMKAEYDAAVRKALS